MTLLDVCKLIKHYIKSFAAIILICTLIGFFAGYMKVQLSDNEYSSEAVLTVSEPTGTVAAADLMPLVQAIATNVLAEDAFAGADIALDQNLSSRTITFTAAGPTEEESVFLANAAARRTAELTDSTLDAMAVQYATAAGEKAAGSTDATDANPDISRALALEAVTFTMNDASDATSKDGSKDILKFGIVGFFAGLFLAICALIILDLVKAPIKGRDEVENAFGIPVLVGGSDEDPGRRLWMNTQFVYEGTPSSICLVPVGTVSAVNIERLVLSGMDHDAGVNNECGARAFQGKGTFLVSAPIAVDVDAVYAARDADATVVAATEWQDSMKQLASTLQELALAQVKVVGIALVH